MVNAGSALSQNGYASIQQNRIKDLRRLEFCVKETEQAGAIDWRSIDAILHAGPLSGRTTVFRRKEKPTSVVSFEK
jgi:hypothetical protein